MKAPTEPRVDALQSLLILSAASTGLLVLRIIRSESGMFAFMAWNLMLAWLPMLAALILNRSLLRIRWLHWKNLGLSLLWLGFLPNSFYMVTDFIHLQRSAASNLVFDAVLFMTLAVTGAALGCVSTYMLHKQFARRVGSGQAWVVVVACFMLSSLAIYLGRYLGWNSWDLIANPFFILFDLSTALGDSSRLTVTVGTTSLFFVYICAIYGAFYSGVQAAKQTK